MADTVRTKADLLANLFQDGQAAESISPQDMRDMIVSYTPQFGVLNVITPLETVISAIDTPVKAAGTTSLVASAGTISSPGNNRLVYTGPVAKNFFLIAAISTTSASNNQVIAFTFAKNGIPNLDWAMHRKTGTGADVGSLTIVGVESLGTNDFVEIFIGNQTSPTDATLNFMQFFIFGFFT